MKLTDSLK